jgi:DNA gyrase subunit A
MGSTGHKPKEEDFVEHMFICSTHNTLLFFTNKGKVYTLKGYEIPEEQKNARGRNVINLLPLEKDEKVQAILPKLADGEGFLVMATRRGLIKKTATSEFESIRKTGKIAINLSEGDELISVDFSKGDATIMVASNEGKCIRFSEKDVKPLGRDTMGVKAIDLASDDYLVDMIINREGYDVLTITENGYGKRSDVSEYKIQNRNGKGMKAGIFNEKTGRLVGLKQVTENEDVMLIANNGVILRTPASSISRITRDTIGVKVMRLQENSRVSCVAIADTIAEDITGETNEEPIVIDEPIVSE